jgi:tRNA U55 pseudouridine synthase TruB
MITEATDTVPDISLVEDSMRSIQGTFSQKYPEFSSKPVDGIPLHVHARSGRRVKIPTHDVTLYKVFFDGETTVSRDELVQRIVSQIRSVKGDFRQDDIVYAWEHVVNAKEYVIVEVTLEVSSGFYVRQYAHDVGMLCNTPACALSITRTKVGQFGVGDCII